MAKDLSNLPVSTESENAIKSKSPDKLPLNPTKQGWSGAEVRRFLGKSQIDNEGSLLSELKAKMLIIKSLFYDIFGEGDGDIQGQLDEIVQSIIDGLTLKVTKAGDSMSGALNMTQNELQNVSVITFYSAEGNAIAYFDGKDFIVNYGGITREYGKNLFIGGKAREIIANGVPMQYDGSTGVSRKIYVKNAVPAEININPHYLIGLSTTTFASGEENDFNSYGAINDIDTTNYNGGAGDSSDEGKEIFFDSINGGITLDKPEAPNVQISLGVLSVYHATQGQLKIKTDTGRFLKDLHEVHFNGHTFVGRELMIYNFANKRWELTNLDTELATIIQNIANLDANKVSKTFTILGIDMQDNILLNEFKIALGNATTLLNGLMSIEDKRRLDILFAGWGEGEDADALVNTLTEVLAVFDNYPEGADILSVLADKVDKVSGKGLSENDLLDVLKAQYDTAYTHSQVSGVNTHSVTFALLLALPTTIAGFGITDAYTKTEIDNTLANYFGGFGQETIDLTPTPLVTGETYTRGFVSNIKIFHFICKNIATGELDTDVLPYAQVVNGVKVIFFENSGIYATVDATYITFTTVAGYELKIYGVKQKELIAENILLETGSGVTLKDKVDEYDAEIVLKDAKNEEQDVRITKSQESIKDIEETLRKSMNDEILGEVNGEEVIDLVKDVANGSPLRIVMQGATEGINKVAYVNKTIDEIVYEGLSLRDIFETNNKFTNPNFDDATPLWGVNSGYSQHDSVLKAMKVYLNVASTSISFFNTLGTMINTKNYYISSKLYAEATTIALKYYHGDGYTSFPQSIEEGWKHYSDIYEANLDTYMHLNVWHNTSKTWMVTVDDTFMIDMDIFTVNPSEAQMDAWRDDYLARRLITKKVLTYKDIFETNNIPDNGDFSDGENGYIFVSSPVRSIVNEKMNIELSTSKYMVFETDNLDINEEMFISVEMKTNSSEIRLNIVSAIPDISLNHSGSGNNEILSTIYTHLENATFDLRFRGSTESLFDVIIDDFFLTSFKHFDEDIDQVTLDALLVYYKKYRAWELASVKFNKRFKVIGQNIFYDELIRATVNTSTGEEASTVNDYTRNKNKVNIKSNQNYSIIISSISSVYLFYYDKYENYLGYINLSSGSSHNFTTPPNAEKLFFVYVSVYEPQMDVTLVEGNNLIEQIPYQETFKYILPNKVGRKVNDVKDTIEYRDGKYYHIQKIKVDIDNIIKNAITWATPSPKTLTYKFEKNITALLSDIKGGSTTNISDFLFRIGNIDFIATTPSSLESIDEEKSSLQLSSGNVYLAIRILKTRLNGGASGDLETLLQAEGAYLEYEIITPIETEIQALGNILGNPLGHVYVESVMQNVALYGTQMDIEDVNYPIESLEYIEIVKSDGSVVKLDIDDATIAGDGLSFTHTGLALGDIVYFTYYYQDPNPFGNSIVIYMDNKYVIQDSITLEWKKWSIELNNGVFAIVGEDV